MTAHNIEPRGRLIAIEGTDGSGKATQTALLTERLRSDGTSVTKLSFPRYDNESSCLVRSYLSGRFGTKPEDVDAYAASVFFAVDRYASFKEDWQSAYEQGGLIITDRYVASNIIHQASKLPEDQKRDYIDWLLDFEHRIMGIPQPDLTLFLDVPTDITARLRRSREAASGSDADIHEADLEYMRRSRETALGLAGELNWLLIPCNRHGAMRPVNDIAQQLYDIVTRFLKGVPK